MAPAPASSFGPPAGAASEGSLNTFDPVALGTALAHAMERARPLLQQYLDQHSQDLEGNPDPLNLGESYTAFLSALLANPQKLAELQAEYWNAWMELWSQTAARFAGEPYQTLYTPDKSDRRFRAPAWQESLLFDYIKQSYLMTSRWMNKVVHSAEGLDKDTQERLEFYTRQFADALSPTNFVLTNPEVLEETVRSGGENLVRGLEHLIADMERGHGELKISTTDYKAFKLGENIAATPGRVVFENELIQLIQYAPATEKVFKRPLLIVPPWINKYYILDLRPENSFVKWLVDQGHTVFMISWVNPTPALAQKNFDDYMRGGVLAALDEVESITGEKDVNAIGYCIGGTLLVMALAWLTAQGQEDRVASATLLTTLVDFDDPGELKLFTDAAQLALLDKKMAAEGILTADHMQKTFSLLRANDLIWSFVVNNYLLGREPFPFDLLYWNDDSTNMPASLHSQYLRSMYLENKLIRPGGIELCGESLDIRVIETPCYYLSTREDHIAPWKATYSSTQYLHGPKTFTLAASGHIAGVINPPVATKYGFWSSSDTPENPDAWLADAKETKGSWWPHWQNWVSDFTGPKVAARQPAKGLEAAPGRYVKAKAGNS